MPAKKAKNITFKNYLKNHYKNDMMSIKKQTTTHINGLYKKLAKHMSVKVGALKAKPQIKQLVLSESEAYASKLLHAKMNKCKNFKIAVMLQHKQNKMN